MNNTAKDIGGLSEERTFGYLVNFLQTEEAKQKVLEEMDKIGISPQDDYEAFLRQKIETVKRNKKLSKLRRLNHVRDICRKMGDPYAAIDECLKEDETYFAGWEARDGAESALNDGEIRKASELLGKASELYEISNNYVEATKMMLQKVKLSGNMQDKEKAIELAKKIIEPEKLQLGFVRIPLAEEAGEILVNVYDMAVKEGMPAEEIKKTSEQSYKGAVLQKIRRYYSVGDFKALHDAYALSLKFGDMKTAEKIYKDFMNKTDRKIKSFHEEAKRDPANKGFHLNEEFNFVYEKAKFTGKKEDKEDVLEIGTEIIKSFQEDLSHDSLIDTYYKVAELANKEYIEKFMELGWNLVQKEKKGSDSPFHTGQFVSKVASRAYQLDCKTEAEGLWATALAEMEGVSLGNAADVARIKYSFTKDKRDKKTVNAYEILEDI